MPPPRKATIPLPRKPRKGDIRSQNNRTPINGKNPAPKLSRNNSYPKPSKLQRHDSNGNSKENSNGESIHSNGSKSPPHYMKIKSKKNTKDLRLTGSKKEITVVTINANGRGALGLTPRYKIDLIKTYLMSAKPDAIFFQVRYISPTILITYESLCFISPMFARAIKSQFLICTGLHRNKGH